MECNYQMTWVEHALDAGDIYDSVWAIDAQALLMFIEDMDWNTDIVKIEEISDDGMSTEIDIEPWTSHHPRAKAAQDAVVLVIRGRISE